MNRVESTTMKKSLFLSALFLTASVPAAHAGTWQLVNGVPAGYTPATAGSFVWIKVSPTPGNYIVSQTGQPGNTSKFVDFKWKWVPNPQMPVGADNAPRVTGVTHTFQITGAQAEAHVTGQDGFCDATFYLSPGMSANIKAVAGAVSNDDRKYGPNGTFTQIITGFSQSPETDPEIFVTCTATVSATAQASGRCNLRSSVKAFVGPPEADGASAKGAFIATLSAILNN